MNNQVFSDVRSAAVPAAISAFVVVPFIMIVLAIAKLFKDESFHMMGMNMEAKVTAHSATASFNLEPVRFFLFLAVMFVLFVAVFYVGQLIRRRMAKP